MTWGRGLRVTVAMLFLAAGKLATVFLPMIYGRAVDALAPKGEGAALVVPVALILGYGLLRVASSGFAELRDAVFAAVQQRATGGWACRPSATCMRCRCAITSIGRPAGWRA